MMILYIEIHENRMIVAAGMKHVHTKKCECVCVRERERESCKQLTQYYITHKYKTTMIIFDNDNICINSKGPSY